MLATLDPGRGRPGNRRRLEHIGSRESLGTVVQPCRRQSVIELRSQSQQTQNDKSVNEAQECQDRSNATSRHPAEPAPKKPQNPRNTLKTPQQPPKTPPRCDTAERES